MTIHKPRQGRDLDASDAQLTVLLASPERSDAVFVERLLSQRAQVVRALSCPEALALHDRGRFEVCLFDVELGEASMLRLLRTFRASGDRVPVVLLAGPQDDELTLRGLRAGARDYVYRGSLSRETLLRSFRYASELARHDRTLEDVSRSHRRLFRRSLAGTFRLSLDGELLDCNTRFLEFLGYESRAEALRHGTLRLREASWVDASRDWVLELSNASRRRTRILRADGTALPVMISAHLVDGADGDPQVLEGSFVPESTSDPSSSRRLEALGRLSGGVMHDLNNLLTTTLGYANLLGVELNIGGGARARAEEIRGSVLRARRLLGNLLRSGRGLPPEPLPLSQAVRALRQPLQETLDSSSCRLAFELPEETPSVAIELGDLERVLTNLVLNSRDAMPQGGVIRVRAVEAPPVDERPDDAPRGPSAVLSVQDGGVGMDRQTRERMFEPFFTTKSEDGGTGLGLVSVVDLARRYGGTVTVSSRPGQGTEVQVWFPAVTGD